jgi:hypothetical protein
MIKKENMHYTLRNIKQFALVSLLLLAGIGCKNACKTTTVQDQGFQIISPDSSGIHFANYINDVEEVTLFNNYYAYNGAGVAVGDINNDDLIDIVLIGNQVESKLYLNKGEFVFEDITSQSNIDISSHWATGVSMVDINDDGFLDIYVCRSGPYPKEDRQNLLYINNGDLSFTESAVAYGLADQGPSTQANFFDIDLDGDLDMYLLNHPLEFDNAFNFYFYYNKDSIDPLFSDKIYIQEGGRFYDRSQEMGLEIERGFGLSTSIMDFNGDSYPDIFVANDFLEPDYLWINTNGHLNNEIGNYFDKCSFYSMGSSLGDINNDGLFDLIVVDMGLECHQRRKMADLPMSVDYYLFQEIVFGIPQYKHNMMYLQDKTGSFHDISEYAGLARTDWSWSPLLADFDNDGLEDALITNGIKRDVIDLDHMKNAFKDDAIVASKMTNDPIAMITTLPIRVSENVFYQNIGSAQFEKVNQYWLANFNSNGQGAALADFDNDGRIDLIINNSDTVAFLIKNDLPVEPALKLSFSFEKGNSHAIGTNIKVFYKDKLQKVAQNNPVKGYYSCSQNAIFVANQDLIDSILVNWPNGKTSSINENLTGLLSYHVNYQEQDVNKKKPRPALQNLPPLLLNSNYQINPERAFSDFKVNKLAHRLHSKEGPCFVVEDVNEDGLDDYLLGGSKGFRPQICYQQKQGNFKCEFFGPLADSLYEDISILLVDLDGDQDLDVYIGSGSFEFASNAKNWIYDRVYINEAGTFIKIEAFNEISPAPSFTKTLLAMDFNKDGINEVISLPRYYVNEIGDNQDGRILTFFNGTFLDVTEKYIPELKGLGMTTDAKIGDIDMDGDLDLVVVGEWMAVTIFRNNNGQFIKEEIMQTNGWWESLALLDLDGDGDLDLVAGNYGENSIFKASTAEPVNLYLEDVNGNGLTNPVLTHYLCGEVAPFLTRDQLCNAIPELYNNFPNYKSYGLAGLKGIVDLDNLKAKALAAFELKSMCFINEKNDFKRVPLPREVQMGPIKALVVDDFDADGCLDILVAGNSKNEFYEMGSILALAPSVLFGDCKGNLYYTKESSLGIPMKYSNCVNEITIGSSATRALLIGNVDEAMQLYSYPKF